MDLGELPPDLPGAIEILDFYHASERVGQLAAAIHDDDPAGAEDILGVR